MGEIKLKWGVFVDPIHYGWAFGWSIFGEKCNGENEFGIALVFYKWTVQIGRIAR